MHDLLQILAADHDKNIYLIKKISDQSQLSPNDFYEYHTFGDMIVRSTNLRNNIKFSSIFLSEKKQLIIIF